MQTPESLAARCEAMVEGAGDAVAWVKDARQVSQRIDLEADSLTEELRRTRNLCRRLGAAARRRFSAGVFGLSQAGKSYLISTLAAGADGRLYTELDGSRLDFIKHLNPPGGSKESTGLVTRFTRQAVAAPPGFPIELSLLSEGDLIKILGNSFFNDFDPNRVQSKTDESHIREHVSGFEKYRRPAPTGGLSEDDMVDLLDYFNLRFKRAMEPLQDDFWPVAMELAPRLEPEHRAGLLSILWGEFAELTGVYLRLREALYRLSHARVVYAPMEALVDRRADGFDWRPDSILYVDALFQLGQDAQRPLAVLPVLAGKVGSPVSVPRSVLAVLTAELTFRLSERPRQGLLESVDLLDFPGYRGRFKVASMDEVRPKLKSKQTDPAAPLLLRGKVAYLFEAYTDAQEMNLLLMCTRSDQQIEVEDLAPVLTDWVYRTQGETPELRTRREAGLVWVITQFDRRLEQNRNMPESHLQADGTNMIYTLLEEKFLHCDWLKNWYPEGGRGGSTAFDNVFLVRKPGFLPSVFRTEEGIRELGFATEEEKPRLDAQRATFVANKGVRKHIRDAGAAWDAVLKANDGGMERLATYLERAASPEAKLDRIAEQLDDLARDISARWLGKYYQSQGLDEERRKEEIAEKVRAAVADHSYAFGELLEHLYPPGEQLRRIYLRSRSESDKDRGGGGAPGAERPSRKAMFGLPGRGGGGRAGRDSEFASAVVSAWIKQLKSIPSDEGRRRVLDLPEDILESLCDELLTAADRMRIHEELKQALATQEEARGATRIQMVDQQVLRVRRLVCEFVDFLGLAGTRPDALPESEVGGRKVFKRPPPIKPRSLPELSPEWIEYSGMYVLDWLTAFRRLAVENAGHSAGREITPELNRRLGQSLRAFEVTRDSAAAGATFAE